jgi:hypothetical protein
MRPPLRPLLLFPRLVFIVVASDSMLKHDPHAEALGTTHREHISECSEAFFIRVRRE